MKRRNSALMDNASFCSPYFTDNSRPDPMFRSPKSEEGPENWSVDAVSRQSSPISSARDAEEHFIGPHPEALKRSGAESGADRNIGRIAATCNQHATDAWDIIARIEGVPTAAEVGFEPSGEVHGCVNRRHANIAEIAGAVTRGNIHAAAKSDGQVGVVPADAFSLVENLPGRLGRAGMLVAKEDMVMDEIADRLDTSPPRGRISEQLPCDFR